MRAPKNLFKEANWKDVFVDLLNDVIRSNSPGEREDAAEILINTVEQMVFKAYRKGRTYVLKGGKNEK